MISSARRRVLWFILFVALVLTACEAVEATPAPRATWTPRAITTVVIAPEPTVPPTATPESSPTPLVVAKSNAPVSTGTNPPAATAPGATAPGSAPKPAGAIPQVPVNDPLLPKFAAFPPLPIPARPANLNPLTGLQADPAMLQRRPIVARIGNDQKVRTSFWQAGTNSADLVFEELIDILGSAYAQTRYSAVYLSNDPPLIGPIRSGRIINFQMVAMLDGALANAGASNGTRWLFSQSPMINLDEYFNMPAYCYNKSHGYQGRLYTTAPRIREWLQKKGWEASVPLYGFTFAERVTGGQPIASVGMSKLPWPSWSQATWRYDAASGRYLRFNSGEPQMDNSYTVTAKWGNGADCIPTSKEVMTQVSTANVVVLYARHEKTSIIEDSNNAVSVYIPLTGQGDAQIFRDGVMLAGKWQRRSEQEFFKFTDANGNVIPLKPGNTWFEIVPVGYQLDLK